jgi:uncharacterized protein YyaL (SSP411 family)/thiol-disulfide isomerase/thioredoxin
MSEQSNRLLHETSPYLLQHAHNPVDWYPWGAEALDRAKSEGKPILLSIGYSACHWCHVMERESFEDPAVASIMNSRFVNIKVDREERPDLDEIYMQATQVFTGGQGGWPMTVFLTPEGKPFMGGTYFPPYPRYGIPSFRQLMDHAQNIWTTQRDRLDKMTAEVSEHLALLGRLPAPAESLDENWLERMALAAEREYDDEHGGFGYAPKFPAHGTLAALLAHHRRSGSRRAEQMLVGTLDNMAKGGMYDLAGGGFARYSVDEEWRIPHFEKMLYDNAQLVPLYLDGWRATGREHYRRVVTETLDYVLREMTHAEGGFCASQDADSEGEEGKFFCWTQGQLKEVLGVLDGARAALLLSVTETGTFEHGTSVLRLAQPMERYIDRDRELLERALPLLYKHRQARIAPGRDDKVITAWNGLMASAFARTGLALAEPRYVQAAESAVEFLLSTLVLDGRLQRTWKDGKAHIPALADDHGALIGALIDLYEATGRVHWLKQACQWADTLVELFWDDADGGLFYTGHDAESLVTRSKHTLGGSEPSGNGLASLAFSRLAVLAGREDLGARADRILKSYQAIVDRAARAIGLEALAAAWRTGRTRQLAIVGALDAPATQALIQVYRDRHLPFCALALVDPAEVESAAAALPWLEGKGQQDGQPTAWLCEGFSCRLPTASAKELASQLDGISREDAQEAGADRRPASPLPSDPESWLNTDRPLPLEALRGRVVVLDFWTYCCINCMHVLPELAALEKHFEGQPVAVIGVHSAKFPTEAERSQLENAIARNGIRHPVVHDPKHETWRAWEVRSWPTVMVLDAQGRIAWSQPGEPDRHTLIATVERLLTEARDTESLGTEALPLSDLREDTGRLHFPGKIRAWPATAGQEMGKDPYGPDARLYLSDTGHHRILELGLSKGADGWPQAQLLRTFGSGEPGHQDGPIQLACFREPQGCDREGDTLYIADTGNHMLRSIDLKTGTVRTLAGTGRLGRSGGLGPDPRKVSLRSPWDVVMAGADNGAAKPGEGLLFIAMAGTHQVWAYSPTTRQLAPFIGDGREAHVDGDPRQAALAQPSGITLYGRYMFIADSETSSIRVLDLESYKVGTVVGQGLFDFGDVDGSAGGVRLQHPMGLTAAKGNIYVADSYNHKIKKIALPGAHCSTLTGGHPSILDEPGGITRLGDFLVVADTGNHRVRVVEIETGEIRDLEWS